MRCDASALTGAGHAMRCHALGQRLVERGHSVDFIGELHEFEWVKNELSAYRMLSRECAQWETYDVVVVDSYAASVQDSELLRSHGCSIVLIEDAASPRMPADLYVQPGMGSAWRVPAEFGTAPLLHGIDALLLRREVLEGAQMPRSSRNSSRINVGLLMGATHPHSLGQQLLDAISSINSSCSVGMIRYHKQCALQVDGPGSIRWFDPGHGGIELLAQSDVIVSAAGVTAWEALHFQRPLALIATADNQEENYGYMTVNGFATGLGRTYLGEEIDFASLAAFLRSWKIESACAEDSTYGGDGLGAVRVAVEIERLKFGSNERRGTGLQGLASP